MLPKIDASRSIPLSAHLSTKDKGVRFPFVQTFCIRPASDGFIIPNRVTFPNGGKIFRERDAFLPYPSISVRVERDSHNHSFEFTRFLFFHGILLDATRRYFYQFDFSYWRFAVAISIVEIVREKNGVGKRISYYPRFFKKTFISNNNGQRSAR